MARAAKYTWSGTGVDGSYTVTFAQEGWGGGTTDFELAAETGGGVPWRREKGRPGLDVDEPLPEQVITFNVVAPSASFMEDIETADELEFTAQIVRDGTTLFYGFVVPGLGARELGTNAVLQVKADTGLRHLKGVDYPNTSDARNRSLLAVARACLDQLALGLGFQTVHNWWPYDSGGVITADPYNQIFPDQIRFTDDEGNPYSCHTVLEQVVRRFSMTLVQELGLWQFIQPEALYSGTTNRWTYNSSGTLTGSTSAYDGAFDYDGTGILAVRQRPIRRRLPAYGQIPIRYEHGKAGRELITNGGFRVGYPSPTGWTVSNASYGRGRRGQGVSLDTNDPIDAGDFYYELDAYHREIDVDAYDPDSQPPGATPCVEQTGGQLTAGAGVDGRLRFALRLVGSSVGEDIRKYVRDPREVPWQFKVGTQWWDDEAQSFTGTETWNSLPVGLDEWTFVEVPSRIDGDDNVFTIPETGAIFIRFYAVQDDKAIPNPDSATPGGDPLDGADWLTAVRALAIDAVAVDLIGADGEEPAATTTTATLSGGENKAVKDEVAFVIGQGPTAMHEARLTLSDDSSATDWQRGPTMTSASGVGLDEFHAKALMRMMRIPRAAVQYEFKRVTSRGYAHLAMEADSLRSWPAHFWADDFNGRFGGEFVRILNEGESGVDIAEAFDRQATGLINTGSGTRALALFASRLNNLLFTRRLTTTSAAVAAGSATSIPINAIGEEVLRTGDDLVIVDPDTGERHVLTMTDNQLSTDTALDVSSYAFPKLIRKGAPIFEHDASTLATLILVEGAFRVLIQGGSIGQLAEAFTDTAKTSLAVTNWLFDLEDNTKLTIVNQTTGDETLVYLSADSAKGDTSISVDNGSGAAVTFTGEIGDAVYAEGMARQSEISQLADQIALTVTNTKLLELLNDVLLLKHVGIVASDVASSVTVPLASPYLLADLPDAGQISFQYAETAAETTTETVLQDDGAGVNGTPIESHTPAVGSWTLVEGTLTIESGRIEGGGTSTTQSTATSAGQADGYIQGVVRTPGSTPKASRLLARWQNANNHIYAEIVWSTGALNLVKVVSGTPTTLATATVTSSASTDYAMKLAFSGAGAEVWWNGTKEIDEPSGVPQPGTAVGIQCTRNLLTFDDLLAEGTTTGEPDTNLTTVDAVLDGDHALGATSLTVTAAVTVPASARVIYREADSITRLTDAEAEIVIQAGQIAQRVTKTVFETFSQGGAAGTLNGAQSGSLTSLTVDALPGGLLEDDELVLIDTETGTPVSVFLTADAAQGSTSLAIDDGAGGAVAIDAADGSPLFLADAFVRGVLTTQQTSIEQNATDITLRVLETTYSAYAGGGKRATVSANYALGSRSTISLTTETGAAFKSGDVLIVRNVDSGNLYEITLAQDVSYSASPQSVTIETATFQADSGDPILPGALTQVRLDADGVEFEANKVYSSNFNGSFDSSGNVTSVGTAGWAISKSGEAVFNDVVARGQITILAGSSGITNLTDAGDLATADTLDDVPNGSTYGRTLASALQAGLPLLSQAAGDLDDISDGATFGKVLATALSGGSVLLAQATGNLDDIANGSTYGKVNITAISAGNILLAEVDGDLDDLSDGTTYGRVKQTSLSAGQIVLSETIGDLDDVDDGTTYGKVRQTILGSGYIQVGSGTKDTTLSGWHVSETEIVGQASGADQVVLNTSGQIVAGAGKVTIDASGIDITDGSVNIGTTNQIWLNDGGDGALAIGGSVKAGANFRVAANGTLTATGATISGSITVTAGSGLGNFTDAGDLALADDLDDVPDGGTYARVNKTIIASGLIQVGSGIKDSTLSGWHISSTEIVGQSSGVDQVVLNTSGQITAGSGAVKLDSYGVILEASATISIGGTNPRTLAWQQAGTDRLLLWGTTGEIVTDPGGGFGYTIYGRMEGGLRLAGALYAANGVAAAGSIRAASGGLRLDHTSAPSAVSGISTLFATSGGVLQVYTGTAGPYDVYHEGNPPPSGSTNADTLDGYDSTDFAIRALSATITGAWTFSTAPTFNAGPTFNAAATFNAAPFINTYFDVDKLTFDPSAPSAGRLRFWPIGTDLYARDDSTSFKFWTEANLTPQLRITFAAGASITPNTTAYTEVPGYRARADLAEMGEYRFSASSNPAQAHYIKIQYSTDASTWYDLTSVLTMSTAQQTTSWTALPGGAQADNLYLRLVMYDAVPGGAATYGQISLETRP